MKFYYKYILFPFLFSFLIISKCKYNYLYIVLYKLNKLLYNLIAFSNSYYIYFCIFILFIIKKIFHKILFKLLFILIF